jgi:hypothetical protein
MDRREAWLRFDSRNKAAVDKQLLRFRSIYQGLDSYERNKLRQWLSAAEEVHKDMPNFGFFTQLRIELMEQIGENEFNCAELPPGTLLKSIEDIEVWEMQGKF